MIATGCNMKNVTWLRLFLRVLDGRFIAPVWWVRVVAMKARYNCVYRDSSVRLRMGIYLVRRLNGIVSFYSRQWDIRPLSTGIAYPSEILMPEFAPEFSNC